MNTLSTMNGLQGYEKLELQANKKVHTSCRSRTSDVICSINWSIARSPKPRRADMQLQLRELGRLYRNSLSTLPKV